jgi:hypothetical protein
MTIKYIFFQLCNLGDNKLTDTEGSRFKKTMYQETSMSASTPDFWSQMGEGFQKTCPKVGGKRCAFSDHRLRGLKAGARSCPAASQIFA